MKIKGTTSTCWVYTVAGYERSKHSKYLTPDDLAERMPGMPVSKMFQEQCPISWVQNGWVEEAKTIEEEEKCIEHGK